MNKRMITTMATVLAAFAFALPAAGQGSASIQEALDKPVALDVSDAPIGEVFAKLQTASGVPFVIDEDTLEYLPYGDQTRLAVTLRHVTLRKALTPMLAPQALQWQIEDDRIRILPSEPLYRLCRRATFEELTTLGQLLTATLQPTAEGGAAIDQLRKVTGNDKLKLFFHVKADEDKALQRGERAMPGTGAAWLDMLCHGQGWTWYLWGDDIVVVDRAMQIKRQLEKHVSLRYEKSQLVTVLLDLARKGRVKLTMTPGVMNYLPAGTREDFNLMMADASISQALEVISGATGLVFRQDAEGILVDASEQLAAQVEGGTRSSTRSRYFVRMSLPGPNGTEIEVFMRPEELPEDVQQQIEQAKDQFVSELRGE